MKEQEEKTHIDFQFIAPLNDLLGVAEDKKDKRNHQSMGNREEDEEDTKNNIKEQTNSRKTR